MPRAPKKKLSKPKVSDVGRVRQTNQRRSQRLRAKSKSLQIQVSPQLTAGIRSAPSATDDEADLPVIHPSLGHWTENLTPNLHWDLSEPGTWIYKRPFTEEEMERTPFFPEQEQMLVALSLQHSWIIALEPREGYHFMTLRCFQEALGTCMQQPVSRAVWNTTDVAEKYDIAMAFFRRTGNVPAIQGIPPLDIFALWKQWTAHYTRYGEIPDPIVPAITEFVTHGATEGSTRLQTIDLLGRNFMFAGLTYLKETNLWELKTTSRHVANMAHHLLPRPRVEHHVVRTPAYGPIAEWDWKDFSQDIVSGTEYNPLFFPSINPYIYAPSYDWL